MFAPVSIKHLSLDVLSVKVRRLDGCMALISACDSTSSSFPVVSFYFSKHTALHISLLLLCTDDDKNKASQHNRMYTGSCCIHATWNVIRDDYSYRGEKFFFLVLNEPFINLTSLWYQRCCHWSSAMLALQLQNLLNFVGNSCLIYQILYYTHSQHCLYCLR